MALFKKNGITHSGSQVGSQSMKNFVEKSKEELPKLVDSLDTLLAEEQSLHAQISSIQNFSVPFKTNKSNKNYPSFLLKYNIKKWREYQRDVYYMWADPSDGKKCIHNYTNLYLYMGALSIYFIGLYIMMINKVNILFNLSPIIFGLVTYIIFEIITGIISVYYWLFRPNYINKQKLKRELKKIESKRKISENDITVKKNIIQQYEVIQVDPEEEYAFMKKDTKAQLRKIIKDSKTQVLENINETHSKRYSTILIKAEELLYLTEHKGTGLTEINKIYNIYLNEINSILLRSNEEHSESIIKLFDVFESFLNRKIQKFKDMSTIEINRDINALTNAIQEEED